MTYHLKFPPYWDTFPLVKRSTKEIDEWVRDFRAARRRPMRDRLNYSFIHTFKPVLDEAPFRSFKSMKAYRKWCERHLPKWLGYGRSL